MTTRDAESIATDGSVISEEQSSAQDISVF
jgi:hypothetical protein